MVLLRFGHVLRTNATGARAPKAVPNDVSDTPCGPMQQRHEPQKRFQTTFRARLAEQCNRGTSSKSGSKLRFGHVLRTNATETRAPEPFPNDVSDTPCGPMQDGHELRNRFQTTFRTNARRIRKRLQTTFRTNARCTRAPSARGSVATATRKGRLPRHESRRNTCLATRKVRLRHASSASRKVNSKMQIKKASRTFLALAGERTNFIIYQYCIF